MLTNSYNVSGTLIHTPFAFFRTFNLSIQYPSMLFDLNLRQKTSSSLYESNVQLSFKQYFLCFTESPTY